MQENTFPLLVVYSTDFNPNHIRVKYSLIVLEGGGGFLGPCLCFALIIGQQQKIWIETLDGMIKAVSNRDICFIKAV